MILTLAQKESRSAFSGSAFDLQEVIWSSTRPHSLIKKSIIDQKLRELALCVVVRDVRSFGSSPWLHIAVVIVDGYVLANGTGPVLSIETRN